MDLSYPVGRFQRPSSVTPDDRAEWIATIEAAPEQFRNAIAGLTAGQLDTPYRSEGWTVRQVVHHVADSHMNSYIRFRLALTEQEPAIKPYEQDLWADLTDSRTAPAEISVQLIDALHRRWVVLLRNMSPADFARTFRHPDMGLLTLDTNLALYSWHSRHHAAHITGLRQRMGW
jgi:hypothetical protein